jgi:hypothetical protein
VASVHLVVGVGVLLLNLAAGVWGLVALRWRQASVSFWYVLRAAQASVLLQVLLGALLLIAGREPAEDIHYMYGSAPLLINMFAEGMRVSAAQREVGELDFESLAAGEQRAIALRIVRRELVIMTFACFLVLAFAIRAAQVSGKLF